MSKNTTFEQISRACLNALGFDLTKESRNQPTVYARFIAIKILLDGGYTYVRIAYLLKRDITTIYFGEKRYNQLIKENNEVFADTLQQINKELEGLCA